MAHEEGMRVGRLVGDETAFEVAEKEGVHHVGELVVRYVPLSRLLGSQGPFHL